MAFCAMVITLACVQYAERLCNWSLDATDHFYTDLINQLCNAMYYCPYLVQIQEALLVHLQQQKILDLQSRPHRIYLCCCCQLMLALAVFLCEGSVLRRTHSLSVYYYYTQSLPVNQYCTHSLPVYQYCTHSLPVYQYFTHSLWLRSVQLSSNPLLERTNWLSIHLPLNFLCNSSTGEVHCSIECTIHRFRWNNNSCKQICVKNAQVNYFTANLLTGLLSSHRDY